MATEATRTFNDGVYKVADASGTAGKDVLTVDTHEGGLRWTTNTPILVKKNRGALAHAILSEEEPLEWSYEAELRGYYGASGTLEANTMLYEAMFGISSANDWLSDEPDSNIHAFIQELAITDPGDAATETVTIPRSFCESYETAEGVEQSTQTCSGRAMVVHPTIT